MAMQIDARGRQAATPAQIPAPGWKDVLSRVYADISEHRILAIAAGVTFYVLLAIFPAIAAFVALYSRRIQPVVATPAAVYRPARNWSRISAGVFQPSVLRGRVFIA